MDDEMKIVITGHVDHGKSTLIGRLLCDTGSIQDDKLDEVRKSCEELGREFEHGFILDHLREEREQSVTIDTTQIPFRTEKRRYVIIDAPGHKEFLKNMITGASQADAAILIADAGEGVQEQTKRHAYMLRMLGIGQVIAVINKMDSSGFSEEAFKKVSSELTGFLKGLGLEPISVVPISARTGDNVASRSASMPWYMGKTFLEVLDDLSAEHASGDGPLRYPIQDVYHLDSKRIYVGRVESGLLRKGDQVTLLPSGKATTISSIEKFMEKPGSASRGESVGVTFSDPWFLERGEIACSKGRQPRVSREINAAIFWMSPGPLKRGEKLKIRCATQEIPCVVEAIRERVDSSTLEVIARDSDEMRDTEAGEVVIRTSSPMVSDPFESIRETGRFVLERGVSTVAGGTIR